MKWFLLFALFASSSLGVAAPEVVGDWLYYKKVFDGIEMPEPPEATLRLRFEFTEGGKSRLLWWHIGEGDYCEREGLYTVEEGHLVDKIVWVNPRNSQECGRDPDMQLGRVTRTPISFLGDDLVFHLHLQDRPLLYVWKRVSP